MKHFVGSAFAFCAALATLFGQQPAQQQPSEQQQARGYHVVLCIKVRDNKQAEYREYLREAAKLTQLQVDSGRYAEGYLFRGVLPGGNESACDYVTVYVFPGTPVPPNTPAELDNLLDKAGVKMTGAEFIARRNALTQLVSSEVWQTVISVGDIRKGDYLFVNHMKVHDMAGYMELERSIWKPMAESWVKDGTLRGWLVTRPVLPNGTGIPFQATTVDVLPNWDGAFKEWPIERTFKQVHPDKTMEDVLQKLGKSRDLVRRELMVLDDKFVRAAKQPSAGGN